MMKRPKWDDYFMAFASVAATRGTCARKRVGAVIVNDHHIIASGYNGAIAGMPHCDDPLVGHDMEAGHCVRTIHAEQNALLQAAKYGASINGATCFSTASPCWACFRTLAQAGVHRFVYAESYREDDSRARIDEVCAALGITTLLLIPSEELVHLLEREDWRGIKVACGMGIHLPKLASINHSLVTCPDCTRLITERLASPSYHPSMVKNEHGPHSKQWIHLLEWEDHGVVHVACGYAPLMYKMYSANTALVTCPDCVRLMTERLAVGKADEHVSQVKP